MKKSALIGLVSVAGLALVGGGAYAVTQIPGGEPDPAATTEPGVIGTPTPDATQPPAASESPEPSTGPEPTQSAPADPAPSTPDPVYNEVDAYFLEWAGTHVRDSGVEIQDADLLAAGYDTCARITNGEEAWGMVVLPELTQSQNAGLISIAVKSLCPDAYGGR